MRGGNCRKWGDDVRLQDVPEVLDQQLSIGREFRQVNWGSVDGVVEGFVNLRVITKHSI